LQSAFTEIGRVAVGAVGWYQQRAVVQVTFIAIAIVACLVALAVLLIWSRKAPLSTWFAVFGIMLVIAFVLSRATSFHHIDRFIKTPAIYSLRWNWIIEIGGIAIVLLASRWRAARPASGSSQRGAAL
jgi:hypothetical protein